MTPAPGSRTFRRNPNFTRELRREVKRRLGRAAEAVRDQAEALVSRSGPSEPGQPPASVTGELADSIQVYGPVERPTEIVAAVGSDLVKARFLEAGTARMQPRPFLGPALAMSKGGVLREMGGTA